MLSEIRLTDGKNKMLNVIFERKLYYRFAVETYIASHLKIAFTYTHDKSCLTFVENSANIMNQSSFIFVQF